jgi:hypothetical protein
MFPYHLLMIYSKDLKMLLRCHNLDVWIRCVSIGE